MCIREKEGVSVCDCLNVSKCMCARVHACVCARALAGVHMDAECVSIFTAGAHPVSTLQLTYIGICHHCGFK